MSLWNVSAENMVMIFFWSSPRAISGPENVLEPIFKNEGLLVTLVSDSLDIISVTSLPSVLGANTLVSPIKQSEYLSL